MLPVKMLHEIIPYQELLGNYDLKGAVASLLDIIPYQELLGNYDFGPDVESAVTIIPYQELLGNYDLSFPLKKNIGDYTIPRAIREL